MSNTEQLTIRRRCAGGCGALIEYVLEVEAEPCAPEWYCRAALVAYKGGHLCRGCESVVEAALTTRRPANRAQDGN